MEEIYRIGGTLDLAITLPDDRAREKSGRVYLDAFCASHDIDLLKVDTINEEVAIEAVRSASVDWLFIIGWSQIAKKGILDAPTRGALGMHPTLLPKGRGRAAIPWAILKGLSETGVSLFQLDEGVDTGPILSQVRISLSPVETATTLYEKVDKAHIELIREVWPALEDGRLEPQAQNHAAATEWPGRRPEDGAISTAMSPEAVDRLVRAVTRPYPGAFYDYEDRRLRIWAGRPAGVEEVRFSPGLVLPLAGGSYVATEWEWESAE